MTTIIEKRAFIRVMRNNSCNWLKPMFTAKECNSFNVAQADRCIEAIKQFKNDNRIWTRGEIRDTVYNVTNCPDPIAAMQPTATATTTTTNPEPATMTTTTEPTTTTITASPTDLAASLAAFVGETLDSRIAAIEAQLVATATVPTSTTFQIGERKPVQIDRAHHEVLPHLASAVADGFKNLLLVGPAGTGKTTLASDLAEVLSLDYGAVSCTAGLSESVFLGRIMPNTAGEWTYRETEFVRLFTGGGVFLADEYDAADPNLLTLINSALANGYLRNPVSEETLTRHEDFIFVAAGNTWGHGADRTYTGRNPIDGATLDRFTGAQFEVGYSEAIEESIYAAVPNAMMRDHLRGNITAMRDLIKRERMSYVVGTRAVVAAVRLSQREGMTLEAIQNRLIASWSPSHKDLARTMWN